MTISSLILSPSVHPALGNLVPESGSATYPAKLAGESSTFSGALQHASPRSVRKDLPSKTTDHSRSGEALPAAGNSSPPLPISRPHLHDPEERTQHIVGAASSAHDAVKLQGSTRVAAARPTPAGSPSVIAAVSDPRKAAGGAREPARAVPPNAVSPETLPSAGRAATGSAKFAVAGAVPGPAVHGMSQERMAVEQGAAKDAATGDASSTRSMGANATESTDGRGNDKSLGSDAASIEDAAAASAPAVMPAAASAVDDAAQSGAAEADTGHENFAAASLATTAPTLMRLQSVTAADTASAATSAASGAGVAQALVQSAKSGADVKRQASAIDTGAAPPAITDTAAVVSQSTPATVTVAGASHASTPLQLHPNADGEFAQGLSERVTFMVQNGLNDAKLQVNPPQLGPIELRIAVAGTHAQVWMTAHSLMTRNALESSTPTLREMLGAQGFAQVSVDISQRSFQERTQQPNPYESSPADDRPVSDPALSAASLQTSTVSAGAINIYA